jgi:3-dehydroquinate dehydratase II
MFNSLRKKSLLLRFYPSSLIPHPSSLIPHPFKCSSHRRNVLVLLFAALVSCAVLSPVPASRQVPPAAKVPGQAARMKILVVNGPNTNLFGRRETGIYGNMSLAQINEQLQKLAAELGVDLIFVQSNHEGVLIDAFQAHMDKVDGALINPAGLSFHSVGLHDVIKAMPFPVVEVHMSNLATRDQIHQHSIISAAAKGTIAGMGWRSYTAALRALVEIQREARAAKDP